MRSLGADKNAEGADYSGPTNDGGSRSEVAKPQGYQTFSLKHQAPATSLFPSWFNRSQLISFYCVLQRCWTTYWQVHCGIENCVTKFSSGRYVVGVTLIYIRISTFANICAFLGHSRSIAAKSGENRTTKLFADL